MTEKFANAVEIDGLMRRIHEIIQPLDGWCSISKGQALASLVVALRPEVVCEVGVYGGRSLFPMALACKEINHGHVIGIDAWNAQVSSSGEIPEHAAWWAKVDHNKLYADFAWKLQSLGLNEFTTIHRAKSDDVEPPKEIGIFHCDGAHTDQAMRDVQRFAPNVIKGGVVILDDVAWIGGAVMRASDLLIEMGFVQLYHVIKAPTDDWAVFQRL